MICHPCRDAGVHNTQANEWARLDETEYARNAIERAVELHAQCPGRSSCDCGHGVGVFVNWTKLANL